MSDTAPGVAQPGIVAFSSKSGTDDSFPTGWQNEQLVSDLLPRYGYLNQAGVVYRSGMQLTSISNATFGVGDALSATLGTAATSTPIAGIWNPPTSTVNAHIMKLNMQVIITALQNTGCSGFVWVGFPASNLITVASQLIPVNCKTFASAGSQCKGLSGLALTGLANLGVYLGPCGVTGGNSMNLSDLMTAVGWSTTPSPGFEFLDGEIIVAPGAVLGLFNLTTPVAHSASASLTWAELPI